MKSRKVIAIFVMFLAVLMILGIVYNKEIYTVTEKIKNEFYSISVKLKKESKETRNKLEKESNTTTIKQKNESNTTTIKQKNESSTTTTKQEKEPSTTTTKQEKEPSKTTTKQQNEENETGDEKTSENDTIRKLPDSIMSTVEYWKTIYPNMTIGVGLYSLDGTKGYEYNSKTLINSACTIKAAYALYVLQECERRGIDIWSTYLTYQEWHSDTEGSGDINLYGYYGAQYSIADLVSLLLQVSDNVAYNMLLDQFPLNDFYIYNSNIGGQNDWFKWGRATVEQRKNEWVAIGNYVNSDSWYSQVMREDLTGTQYAYFLQGMQNWHSYMQKSGWTEENPEYPAACEAAIIDDSYILIVLTEDYTDEMGHTDVLESIGGAVESFWYEKDGYIF